MELADAHRILICLRYGIGDLIMELPVIDALRSAAPTARITALGARPAVDLLAGDPRIDNIFSVQQWGYRHWGDAGNTETTAKVNAWLRESRFDLVLDASHAVIGVRDALRASTLPLRDTFEWMHNEGLAKDLDGVSAIQYAVHIGWGLHVSAPVPPKIHLAAEDLAFAQRLLENNLSGDGPLCAISAVASSPLKRWPIERLARLADALGEQFALRFLLFCGPQAWTAEAFLRAGEHRYPLLILGDLHLKRVAALLGLCDFYVGNDTGLMHIASAMGARATAVFGPTSQRIYLPRDSRAVYSTRECLHRRETSMGPPACIVQGECIQSQRSCVDDIDVASVIDAVTRLWTDAQPPSWAGNNRSMQSPGAYTGS